MPRRLSTPCLPRRAAPAAMRGVTLVELIVVIAVVGILAGIVALFIRNPIDAYLAVTRRAALVDGADTALLRISREVRNALPNSLRVTQADGRQHLEFLPVADAGRYREALAADGTGDILDFSSGSDDRFDVLGPPVTSNPEQYLVMYNLGLDAGSDAWQGGNRRAVLSFGSVSQVRFVATGSPLPLASPDRRFFIVDGPVSFVCDPAAGTLTRYWGYPPSAAQPTSFPLAQRALLATRVTACSFDHAPGVGQRLGQLTLRLRLEDDRGGTPERVSLYREVVVNHES